MFYAVYKVVTQNLVPLENFFHFSECMLFFNKKLDFWKKK